MLGGDRRAFDQRQQIALHAFARHIGAAAVFTGTDLVDLVEENDGIAFGLADRFLHHLILIEQLIALFGDQRFIDVAHGGAARFGLAAQGFSEQVAQGNRADRSTRHVRQFEHRRRGASGGHFDFDLLVVEFAGAQLLAKTLARGGRSGGANQCIEHALFGGEMRLGAQILALALLHHGDRHFDQVAHDLFDVAADIADLGELGGFDFQERRTGQFGDTAGDFGLAAAGGADHQDVLGQHFLAHRRFKF